MRQSRSGRTHLFRLAMLLGRSLRTGSHPSFCCVLSVCFRSSRCSASRPRPGRGCRRRFWSACRSLYHRLTREFWDSCSDQYRYLRSRLTRHSPCTRSGLPQLLCSRRMWRCSILRQCSKINQRPNRPRGSLPRSYQMAADNHISLVLVRRRTCTASRQIPDIHHRFRHRQNPKQALGTLLDSLYRILSSRSTGYQGKFNIRCHSRVA